MISKCSLFTIILAISAQTAWASSDNFCEPNWTINNSGGQRCNNLPILSPGNDTRVNLKMMLIDQGRAELRREWDRKDDLEFGYAKVPFSLNTFQNFIFKPMIKDESDDDNSEIYGGSRCVSNETGAKEFAAAVEQETALTPEERKLLLEARQQLSPNCAVILNTPAVKPPPPLPQPEKPTTEYNMFNSYIQAASAFYAERYGEAGQTFSDLAKGEQPWLKETALYMIGRTELNYAQQNAFDQYGYPDLTKVDLPTLQKAETILKQYLQKYPDGLYCQSARGLLRRVYWLSNQAEKLADEYVWLLNNPDSPQHNTSLNELVAEADNKLFTLSTANKIKAPLLLATLDLSQMRSGGETPPITFAELQKQQALFSDNKELFSYLLAIHRFHIQNDAAAVLKELPDTIPAQISYLDFSRLLLRGMAMEKSGNHRGARTLWLELLKRKLQPLQNETVQLALAVNYEQHNNMDDLFAANSPLTVPEIRAVLLRGNASPTLLRRVIQDKTTTDQERQIATYNLLYNDLLLGHYRDYISDFKLLPADAAKYKTTTSIMPEERSKLALFTWKGNGENDTYGCPSTIDIAKKLSKNPNDPEGLLCLGDFINANDLDAVYFLHSSSKAVPFALGTSPSHFTGNRFSRGNAYQNVINNPKATDEQKAYAYYRAIKCYATSGSNHCGNADVDKDVRKKWFKTLKTRYGNSTWSKSLKYYW